MINGIIDCCFAALYDECKKMFVTVGRLQVKRLNWSVKYMFGSCAGEC
jgi:hypothetical protein